MAESNGTNSPDRLDRIERIVEVLANTQADMQQDIKNLTFSQVSMSESLNTLTAEVKTLTAEMRKGFADLRESQQHTDDRLNTLIDGVDKMIRGRGPQ
jgi:DNA anti-recombination protein RmuC